MNPNEYNEDQFLEGSMRLIDVVADLWEAGASEDDIRAETENAIENVGGERSLDTPEALLDRLEAEGG